MDLKEKTTKQLNNELKGVKMTTGALIGILSVLFILCVFGLFTKEDNSVFRTLIIVPLALSAIIPMNFSNMKRIKKEIQLRDK
ncbi:hypothetical protein [Winogradskyella sp. Asnod2-B02-A]|jgi:hypothetical protein|uniref:hypothetical protein n=1 Tax=Winogradskyella sp. Asnod2-B02-A TaxID=3160583 RepID=UPI00386F78E7